MAQVNDTPKSRGPVVGGAVLALLVAGGLATLALTGGQTNGGGSRATNQEPIRAQTGDPGLPAGESGTAGAAPAAATTQAPAAPAAPAQTLKGTSFSGMPEGYGTGGGAAGGGGFGGGFGGPPAGFGGGGAAATTPSTGGPNPAAVAELNIKRGQKAAAARPDPFVSYRIPKVEKTPAYVFLAPGRLAKLPTPPPPPKSDNPELQYGPLPYVPRRVAGILYNGSVSAILEIGNPGPGAEVFIVSPGSRVPSGAPGVDDLTVASISPTQVVLRADDGRTTTVALSGAPGAAGQIGGAPGGGGFGGPPAGFRGRGGNAPAGGAGAATD